MKKKILSILLALTLVATPEFTSLKVEAATPTLSDVVEANKDAFDAKLQEANRIDDGDELGARPFYDGREVPEISTDSTKMSRARAAILPSSYITGGSMENLKSQYPVLRNQNPYGTCWAFSTIGAAEFSMITQEDNVSSGIDLSELHTAYFANYSVPDPLGNTDGDYNVYVGQNYLKDGGNYIFSAHALASWMGAVEENEVPYQQAASTLTNGLAPAKAYANTKVHARNIWVLSYNVEDASAMATLKQMIRDKGSFSLNYYDDLNGARVNYNATENTYYGNKNRTINHAVMAVGWDDDKYVPGAPATGAWLIRNTWANATSESHEGYFWLSYYDQSIHNEIYVFDCVSSSSSEFYRNNYQYDGSELTYFVEIPKTANSAQQVHLANVFVAQNDESLEAVSIETNNTDLEYTVNIYKNITDKTNLDTCSTKVNAATTTGTFAYAGINQVKLSSPVGLNAGDEYAVEVVLTSKNQQKVEVGVEWSEYIDGWIDCYATSQSGESFDKIGNGKWEDYGESGYGNIRIKAFTNTVTASDITYNVSFHGNGATSGSTAPLTQCKVGKYYTVRNGFEKKGATFLGWNTKPDGTGTFYTGTERLRNLSRTNGTTVILYAQWNCENYQISYFLNGGTNDGGNPDFYNIDTPAITLKNPTRMGYTFDGWYTDSSFKNKITQIPKGSYGNKTLYAKWTANKYTITYKLNGGKNVSGNPGDYTLESSTIYLKNPTRTGYVFGGWYADSAYRNRVNTINQGSTGNRVLYAKWTPIKYKIKFNGNKSTSGKMSKLTLTYDKSKKLTKNKFKRKGYKFVGWTTKKNGKGKVYKNKASVKNLANKSNKTVTLYAKWKKK